jgi:hypothetical protein
MSTHSSLREPSSFLTAKLRNRQGDLTITCISQPQLQSGVAEPAHDIFVPTQT